MTNTLLTGTVEKLVFGGDGLIRKDGLVIFVPDVIPGEEVSFEIVSQKKNFARALPINIIQPSADRIKPRCSHFGTCGGCQLQHINPKIHHEIKAKWLSEAFFGLFKKELHCIPTNDIFFWRRKITLHAVFKEKTWTLGYFSRDNKTIFAVKECPLFSYEKISDELLFLNGLLHLIPAEEGDILDVELFKLPSEKLFLNIIASFSLPKSSREKIISALQKNSCIENFSLQFGTWSHFEKDLSEQIPFKTLNKTYYFSLQAFIQNHSLQGERLWQDVIALTHNIEKKQTIFDLYAGVGVTAIALADKGHNVIAVEGNKQAVLCGEKACLKNLIKPKFICTSVEEALQTLQTKANTWVMNPPRTGLSKMALAETKKRMPEHIIYVSCSPATLARDVKELTQCGWNLSTVQGYDMFPQTTHLETIVSLSRSK